MNEQSRIAEEVINSGKHLLVEKPMATNMKDLNKIFNVKRESKPILGFFQPMVTCCFVQDDNIFIQAFCRVHAQQYSFIYDWKNKQNIMNIQKHKLDLSTKSNFPVKSFFN